MVLLKLNYTQATTTRSFSLHSRQKIITLSISLQKVHPKSVFHFPPKPNTQTGKLDPNQNLRPQPNRVFISPKGPCYPLTSFRLLMKQTHLEIFASFLSYLKSFHIAE